LSVQFASLTPSAYASATNYLMKMKKQDLNNRSM
jgi:hypothetical protein